MRSIVEKIKIKVTQARHGTAKYFHGVPDTTKVM
jgi:hypothetical protein